MKGGVKRMEGRGKGCQKKGEEWEGARRELFKSTIKQQTPRPSDNAHKCNVGLFV